MEEDERTVAGRRQQDYRFGRILAISDGVFAFSLTLLVVDLVIPTSSSNSALASQLVGQLPALLSYLISFAVVALTWNSHRETFGYIRHADGWLIVLNFALLLLVAFLPFPTAVLGRNQNEPLAAVIYAVTLTLINLAAAAIWWYATRGHRLVDRDLDHHVVKKRFSRLAIGVAVFLVSIPVALWQPYVAEIMWLPLFGVVLFIRTPS
jgi:TMEM175 potassium channel family protein